MSRADETRHLSDLLDFVLERAVIATKGIEMGKLIEIKGLSSALTDARKGMKDARAVMATVRENTSGLVAELQDINQQITDARADLRFEAETLGNSNGSDQQSEQPETPKSAPAVAEQSKPFPGAGQ